MSRTLLDLQVWDGPWYHELSREEVGHRPGSDVNTFETPVIQGDDLLKTPIKKRFKKNSTP